MPLSSSLALFLNYSYILALLSLDVLASELRCSYKIYPNNKVCMYITDAVHSLALLDGI